MEYSFINDPVLRGKLEKANKKSIINTKTNDVENKLSKNVLVSNENSINKRISKPNKKLSLIHI